MFTRFFSHFGVRAKWLKRGLSKQNSHRQANAEITYGYYLAPKYEFTTIVERHLKGQVHFQDRYVIMV